MGLVETKTNPMVVVSHIRWHHIAQDLPIVLLIAKIANNRLIIISKARHNKSVCVYIYTHTHKYQQ